MRARIVAATMDQPQLQAMIAYDWLQLERWEDAWVISSPNAKENVPLTLFVRGVLIYNERLPALFHMLDLNWNRGWHMINEAANRGCVEAIHWLIKHTDPVLLQERNRFTRLLVKYCDDNEARLQLMRACQNYDPDHEFVSLGVHILCSTREKDRPWVKAADFLFMSTGTIPWGHFRPSYTVFKYFPPNVKAAVLEFLKCCLRLGIKGDVRKHVTAFICTM